MSKSKVPIYVDAIQTIAQDIDADYGAYVCLEATKKKSVHMNEARLSELEASFEEARSLHQKIVEAPPEELKVKYMETLTFHKLKEVFFCYSSELKQQLTVIETQNSFNKSIGGSNAPSVELKLPHIKIPTFDGSLKMWPEFKGLFEGLVNKNTSISDAHKLHYLKSNITGEAARMLRNTDTSFESAWALLIKRFQNIRLLKDNQFKLLFDQPKVTQESSEDLKLLLDTTNESKQSLKNLGVPVESWEDVLIFHTVQKLPFTTRGLWESHISTHVDYPKYSILEDFILMRSRTLDILGQSSSGFHPQKPKPKSSSIRAHNSTILNKCSLCQGLHSIRNCFKFKAFKIQKRLEFAKKRKLCLNCLSSAHLTQSCTSTFTCSTCQQKHHSLLHTPEPVNAMPASEHASTAAVLQPTPPASSSTQNSQSGSSEKLPSSIENASAYNAFIAENTQSAVLLATALIKVMTPTGQPLQLRALVDPGSEASFITESAAQLLNMKKERSCANIIGVGETTTSTSKYKVTFTILSRVNANFSLQLNALVLPKLTALLPTQNITNSNWSHLQNLTLADPSFNKTNKIDVLLGSDVYPFIILEGLIKGEQGSPIAQKTELGWVLSGGISSKNNSKITSLHMKTEPQTLDNLLVKFWELERVPNRQLLSPEEEQCETHFCRTHQRQLDGKYMVQLPFKEVAPPLLGWSQKSAFVRFVQLEKRFKANASFCEEYKRVFNEYKDLNHMTEVGPTALSSPHYFLPHHAVMKESSSTTKLRIVFDASCKTSDGTSLNDHLFIGPRLQDDIFDHISRFRKHKIAFTADINKMYRQIWVTPNDSLYQLILWRDLEGDGVKIYRLNTVTFGTASAPYLAIRTLQQLAADERDDYPIASKIALKNFYVDDVIHGADSVAEALEMQSQLITMLKHGGFPLRKWASNCEMLLTSVPEEDREIQVPLSFREEDAIKALGIQWHPAKDIFTFKIALQDLKTTTKRSILSDLARLYDPMGWIAPCVIVGKILMQDIWKEKHTWDSELPATIVSAWHKLKMELNALKAIEIPRWINFTKESKIEVHGFCDASEKAYAAAIYLRITTGIKIYTNLILAKTRVAPLKNKSIARLELCGALLLAQLLVHTVKTMELQSSKIFAWCDSQITLAWIKSAPYIRTTFVANRVAEIQELTDPQRWNYVPSKKNPADIASRGVSPNELVENHQWWYGPAFLQGFDEQLHLSSEIKSTDLETKASEISKTKNDLIASGYPIINIFQLCVHFTCFETNQPLFERFSSLNRLYRAAAYWRRYLTNLKFKAKNITTRISGPLSVDEISSARTRLIVYVQKEFFAEDISRLTKGDTVSKRSKLARLSPIVDEKGILRVGGRLENADLPYSQRHPIILPSQGFLTSLIVHDTHMKLLHGGQQLMMAILRTEYWIVHLKSTVKKCIHKCLKCYRFTATEMQQQHLMDTKIFDLKKAMCTLKDRIQYMPILPTDSNEPSSASNVILPSEADSDEDEQEEKEPDIWTPAHGRSLKNFHSEETSESVVDFSDRKEPFDFFPLW
ncbi:uncharacterized protein LOC129940981 [Eupeodes corollae]|uniref:uncharacterized protein LOC129940981 n=1 Tax=Eupeodes corollae TaxID=290404 RepID=UPI002491F0FA|nr:uncharacterized protein LOC129940981 [Eupeodes corollae]